MKINFNVGQCPICRQTTHIDNLHWVKCCRRKVCEDCYEVIRGKYICVDHLPIEYTD